MLPGGGGGGAPPGTGGARAGETGGGGARPEGLREEGGGMGGFLPIGGGGLGFMLILEATDDGLESLNPPRIGFSGGRPPGTGGAGGAPGGLGADARGNLGAELRDVSGSERYGALPWSAPVLTPPDFLSLGMPPANSPASCGAAAMVLSPPPVSLLLLALFPAGVGGARPGGCGGLPIPGTGGAEAMGGALGPSLTLPTMGAERSLTTVTFLSRAPLPMSDSRAPYDMSVLPCTCARHADFRFTAVRLRRQPEDDILFQRQTAPLPPVLSFQALAGAAVVPQRLVPWAAWGAGAVVRASCRALDGRVLRWNGIGVLYLAACPRTSV